PAEVALERWRRGEAEPGTTTTGDRPDLREIARRRRRERAAGQGEVHPLGRLPGRATESERGRQIRASRRAAVRRAGRRWKRLEGQVSRGGRLAPELVEFPPHLGADERQIELAEADRRAAARARKPGGLHRKPRGLHRKPGGRYGEPG